jgi:hypothetical protein
MGTLLLSGLLTGCDKARNAIGLEKQAPDEFTVVTRAPLSLPPDFGLRPPEPGSERPQEKAVQTQARDVLLRTSKAPVADAANSGRASRGEAAFLARAGALNTDPAIRRKVNRESTAIAEADESFLDKVFFWQEAPKPGTIVDPDKESRRIREARALGDAVNKGEVPVIERKKKGILEGIF